MRNKSWTRDLPPTTPSQRDRSAAGGRLFLVLTTGGGGKMAGVDDQLEATRPEWVQNLIYVGIGLIAGLSSGMFGVGGGTIIVPILIAALAFQPKLASGTSLAVIIPLASIGVISYAVNDSVSWLAALLIAAGAMFGAKIGTWVLTKIAQRPLQIAFSFVMMLAVVSMFVVIPSRDSVLEIDFWSGLFLTALGLLTGFLAGLLGIGGGLIVVPALMIFFGASDLVAKGTSLLMMIPSAIVGTLSNMQIGRAHV